MTVTVFKKNCDWADESYKPCSHSSYCIRKDFFCDGRVNCAFPYGDVGGTDEVNCDLKGKRISNSNYKLILSWFPDPTTNSELRFPKVFDQSFLLLQFLMPCFNVLKYS